MQRALRRIDDERGVALITVIGVAATMFVLAAVIAVAAVNDLRQAREERMWEQAIHVADAGVDHALFHLQEDEDYDTNDMLPPAGFDSVEEEKEWVLDQAATANLSNGRLHTAPEGEWVAIKPPNANVIYAVGFTPSKDEAEEVRVVRAEYDFGPFVPGTTILSGGSMGIPGNPEVDGSLHVNGNLTVSGNPTITGCLSSSGSYNPGGAEIGDPSCSGGGMTPLEVIAVAPRDLYETSEYDLCPDGKVRKGPSYPGPGPNASGQPCQGGVLATATATAYRGWKWDGLDPSLGARWYYDTEDAYDGTYYFFEGSVEVGKKPGFGQPDPWEATLIAEPVGITCPYVGGHIKINGNPVMRYHPNAQPLALVAGRDVDISGNPDIEGAIVMREQLVISGNPKVLGTVVIEDACNTVGSPVGSSAITGNPTVTEVAGQELPAEAIRTSLWLEL